MKKLLTFLCALCLLLAGCTPGADAEVRLYFPDAAGEEIKEETRKVKTEGSLLETAVRALLEGPEKAGNTRIIPAETTLLDVKTTGTVAEINLSAAFDTGTTQMRLLSRYTLIYTACSVPDVQKVKLLVEGKPLLSLKDGSVLGALGMADVSLAGPGSGEQMLLTLYFPDTSAAYLVPEPRQITLMEGETAERAIINEILRGPSSSHLAPALSEDTAVLSAETRAGICFVNMNEAFLRDNTGDKKKERAALYAVVNSLCALPEIQEVRFLVEGKTVESFGAYVLSDGLTEDETLYLPA